MKKQVQFIFFQPEDHKPIDKRFSILNIPLSDEQLAWYNGTCACIQRTSQGIPTGAIHSLALRQQP